VDDSRYLACLADDYARLREVAGAAADARVPSCPDWTGDDLVRHVAEVYRHKTETMRHGRYPLPPDFGDEPPVASLDRTYNALIAEFAARKPDEWSLTWYEPDQTVGFWMRRMAQETVIHRIDAELAAGVPHAPIPVDLAVDGIDEVLVRFLGYESVESAEEFGPHLSDDEGRTVRVDTAAASWSIQLGPTVVSVEPGHADAEASVGGEPGAVLRWLWRRAGDEEVVLDGFPWVIGKLRQLMGLATQ
jgi:uncharacterized protein (TIGR03083 family)